MRLYQKSKSIIRRSSKAKIPTEASGGRKVFTQRTQRIIYQCFNFAYFAPTLCSLCLMFK
jgi:hypothetical protein